MRERLYDVLVNRKSGIAYRYHEVHDGTKGLMRVVSWAYLLWLNFAYYVLFFKFLGRKPAGKVYEDKRLPADVSESALAEKEKDHLSVSELFQILKEYDVISFDIFDTLIFRGVEAPADVFYFAGTWLGVMDFRRMRINAEAKAREKMYKKEGHLEVGIEDIWRELIREINISPEEGMKAELRAEEALCYGNPFMRELWEMLSRERKRIIVTSDMYLGSDFLVGLLRRCGFDGFEKIYVSCEYKKSKGDGGLYEVVKNELGGEKRIAHMGDNEKSDVKMARRAGFTAVHYPNINRASGLYRAHDMSFITGSAYRALVNAKLYCGLTKYSMDYELGYVYGGLFVVGYCRFIHDYCEKNGVDALLFLSRDGDILKKVYGMLYPEDACVYVHWSRNAAVKLMAEYDRHDFFRRMIYHKTGQGYSISQVLSSMELSGLEGKLKGAGLSPAEELSSKNVDELRKFIEKNWDMVRRAYAGQAAAARDFFAELLRDKHLACAVDIGWAGSGAMAISYLAERVWRLDCEVRGLLAGTNSVNNAESDASEGFLRTRKLNSFLYSAEFNRELWKKHDAARGHNLFWERLLASEEPKFLGYYEDGLHFAEEPGDAEKAKAREIRQGIVDFAGDFTERYGEWEWMTEVSGRDAYAPVMLAFGRKGRRFLRRVCEEMEGEANVE